MTEQVRVPLKTLNELMAKIQLQRGYSQNRPIIRGVLDLLQGIKDHHPGTYKHSINVARLSTILAMKLGLEGNAVRHICLGALLHDIGKTKVDRTILNKPLALTYQEWVEIKRHPLHGVALLGKYQWSKEILAIVMQHHERVDGQGYFGFSGDQILLSARIVAITDAFDAMFSARPYKTGRPLNECWNELQQNSGRQFSPELVEPFVRLTSTMISSDCGSHI